MFAIVCLCNLHFTLHLGSINCNREGGVSWEKEAEKNVLEEKTQQIMENDLTLS